MWVDTSELHGLFHSNRTGDTEIFRTRRAAKGQPFEAPVAVDELNESVFDDQDPWLSPDGRTIMFASNRTGDSELYTATR